MSANSAHAIYEGWVLHRRTAPTSHEFKYRIQFAFLDLDELSQAFSGRWLWSCEWPSVAWFRRADHLGDPHISLPTAVRQLVNSVGLVADGPIRLLTQLRYWGFVMNPVSFYYCYDAAGEQLQAVVAEVHNTPWGEEHSYVLPVESMDKELWLDKQFHVSPFMPLDLRYRWQLSLPGDSLHLGIENYQGSEQFFTASLQLQRRPWTTRQLHLALWRNPFPTLRIFVAIYWQALRLWWKGTQYFPHPGAEQSSKQRTTPTQEKLACHERG